MSERLFRKISLWKGWLKRKTRDENDDGNRNSSSEGHVRSVSRAKQVTSIEKTQGRRRPTQPPAATSLVPQIQLSSRAAQSSRAEQPQVSGNVLPKVPLKRRSVEMNKASIQTNVTRHAAKDFETTQKGAEGEADQPVVDTTAGDAEQGGKKVGLNPLVADVAPQTSAGEHEAQTRPSMNTFSGPQGVTYVPLIHPEMTSGLPETSTEYQQGSLEEETAQGHNILDPGTDAPDPGSPTTGVKDVYNIIQAWTTSILPGLNLGFGVPINITELVLPEPEIRTLIQKHRSPLDMLRELNNYQRHLVLAHVSSGGSTLLHVDVWRNESMPTVFGTLNVATLIWVTSSTEKRERSIDIEALFRQERMSKKEADSSESHEPIIFKDAVGRTFVFPFHLAKSWKGMRDLVRQAFLFVDILGPHVQQGHYDLLGPDSHIILPQVWESMIQPGWTVTMHMWPIPEIPLPPPPPPPPPPPLVPPPFLPPPPIQLFMRRPLLASSRPAHHA